MKVSIAESFDDTTRERFLSLVDRYVSEDVVEQVAFLFGPADGVYDPVNRTIIITSTCYPDWDFIEGTLVHELTHAEDDRKVYSVSRRKTRRCWSTTRVRMSTVLFALLLALAKRGGKSRKHTRERMRKLSLKSCSVSSKTARS